MYETLEYIEAYFQQKLDKEERTLFEQRCVKEEAFANEVAFYIAARGAVLTALLEQKQETWAEETVVKKAIVKEKPVKKIISMKWLPYAAAACLIFIIAAYFRFQSPASEQLAANYMQHYQLSQAMDADDSRDSIQLGIAAYKGEQYDRALTYFDGVRKANPSNSEAQTYSGLAYYKIKDYDKALQCFEELAALKGQHNLGDFFKAATLLQRGKPGDKEKARALLEKVNKENEDGSDKAGEWLDKWK